MCPPPLQFSKSLLMVILTVDSEKGLCTRRSYPQGGPGSRARGENGPDGSRQAQWRGETGVRLLKVDTRIKHTRSTYRLQLLRVLEKPGARTPSQESCPTSECIWSPIRKSVYWEWNNHRQPYTQGHMQTEVTKRKTPRLSPQSVFTKPFQKNNTLSPQDVMELIAW